MTEHPAITPGPPLSALDAAAQLVAEQSRELRHQGRRVRRKNDPEAVHEMRVATRRLRTALRALRGHVAPPRSLKNRLGWLAEALGTVRDRDVVLDLLRAQSLPAGAREERARLARLVERLEKKRHQALKGLRRALERRRYQRLKDDLDAFAATPRGAPEDLMASRLLTEVSEALGRAVAESEGMNAAAPGPEALHHLRIMFKRLRYALDFHAAASGLSYEIERRTARAMQDVLGEIHDRDLLLQWLAAGEGAWQGPWSALSARLTDERARLMRRFLRLRREWSARTRPEPTVASLQAPRFVNLEVQPVTLRLVTGPKHVASSLIA